jgi:putative phosphoribosyl transferase
LPYLGLTVSRLALFSDRRDAGRRLAEVLDCFAGDGPLVVALPRGGVPVGFEIAKALGAPLDILLVRKLGAPLNPEYGIGAIAEGGVRFIRRAEAELTGMSDRDLDEVVARELGELERRQRLYRGKREAYPVEGRTVLMVDDGIATGGTAAVAAQALKSRGAAKVVLAVPVAPPGAEERLAGDFDEIVCLEHPPDFFGIGQFYADFRQVGDDEVIQLLAEAPVERPIVIEPTPGVWLAGDLCLPESAAGLVVFAHGSGSSRLSPRNRRVAGALNEAGFGTLLLDLLTGEEELDRAKAFDIALLSERLLAVTRWAEGEAELQHLPISYFGASTGAAAALRAAARLGGEIRAVVSRGGRPDLAAGSLEEVVSPTLLIVGGADWQVLELNEQAAGLLRCEHEVATVPGATHLFEEPGALERVADLAADWLSRHLPSFD